MSLRKTKTETHEQKLDRLQSVKDSSLAVFVQAATDLDKVAAEADVAYEDIDAEIERLRDLRGAAEATANEAGSKAAQIRATFLGA